jgi:hypothetical protein
VTQRRRKENQKKRRGKNLTKWRVCFKRQKEKKKKKKSPRIRQNLNKVWRTFQREEMRVKSGAEDYV